MHLVAIINFLKQVDELSIAKELLDTFAKYSSELLQFNELGMLYEKVKAYSKSLEMLEKCYSITYEPKSLYAIRSNFAKVYNHLNEPLKSLFYSNLNLEINPLDYEMKMEQSFSYYLYADFDKSWEIQNKLLQDPTLDQEVKDRINFNMGTFDMKNGLFKQGMEKMILGGKHLGIWPPIKKPFEKWNGNYTSKILLVYAEAGIGDQIIHIRFMNELKKRNIKAIWIGGNDDIREVFKYNNYNVLDNDKSLDPFEEYIYTDSTSLSVLLKLDINELWNSSYLQVPIEYIEKWQKILPTSFVTIRWNGNPYYDQNLHRGIPFELLFQTVKSSISDNISIVSLQIDENKIECPELININIENWFDTLAIQFLALTNITSCTSTAHSAGAIGSNCIVLPPICTYYPWINLKENKTSHWYGDNLKVIIQSKWRDWDDPMNMIKQELGVLNA